jgi:endonuclease III
MKAKMRTNTEPEVTTDISTAADMTTTVESEDDAFLLDRNTYKSIKKMDRASLEVLIQDIHESGRRKGRTEALKEAGVVDDHTGEPEINLDLRELEKSIRAVKGVGEKRAEEIMQIIEQWMGV